jgi:hypothetical protein
LLLAEAFSLALVATGAVLVHRLWGAMAGILFSGIYITWRLTRPRWAAQLFTKITAIRFPLTPAFESSRRLLDEIKARILAAQERMQPAEAPIATADALLISADTSGRGEQGHRKRSRFILYGLLFGFGAVSGFAKATVALYCFAFLMMPFVPRDFDFPLSIRSAIVLNQLVAVLRIIVWFASFRYPLLFLMGQHLQFNHEFTLASLVFSLFGLIAIVMRSRESGESGTARSTVLGLGNPAV